MKVAFFGTSDFAVPTLSALLSEASVSVACAVTPADRPRDRGHRLQPTPVKMAAIRHGIPVFQPHRIRSDEAREYFERVLPDLVVVVSYGQIIPNWLLNLPAYGVINVHASLLPRYRGAAPIQWAIMNGEATTGVTTMLMDEGLDTGPVLLQHPIDIGQEETAGELHDRLASLGAELLINTIHRLQQGSLVIKPQDHQLATLAPKLSKDATWINWSQPAMIVHNLVRAFNPSPGAMSRIRGHDVKIWKTRPRSEQEQDLPSSLQSGQIHVGRKHRLWVGCAAGIPVELLGVSLPSRKHISGSELVNGLQLKAGESFEAPIQSS